MRSYWLGSVPRQSRPQGYTKMNLVVLGTPERSFIGRPGIRHVLEQGGTGSPRDYQAAQAELKTRRRGPFSDSPLPFTAASDETLSSSTSQLPNCQDNTSGNIKTNNAVANNDSSIDLTDLQYPKRSYKNATSYDQDDCFTWKQIEKIFADSDINDFKTNMHDSDKFTVMGPDAQAHRCKLTAFLDTKGVKYHFVLLNEDKNLRVFILSLPYTMVVADI
ncbi:hypothetical protein X975_26375, partial [Stegodyphus mimosarum]